MISNTIPRKNTNNTITHRSVCLSVQRTLIIKFFRASLALLTRGKEGLTADVLLCVGHLILKMIVGGWILMKQSCRLI